jgi:hypothetical protein
MQFRLTYQGPLPSQQKKSGIAVAKHLIRKQLHKQLAQLWKDHDFLKFYVEGYVKSTSDAEGNIVPLGPRVIEAMADKHRIGDFRFVPLVGDEDTFGPLSCALDILFLRRSKPGALVSGGDIDNRIKTLLDALRMPQDLNELKNIQREAGEDPFYCLMTDDRLVTEIKVTTDQLLMPPEPHRTKDVNLVIHVRTSRIFSTPWES